MGPGIDTALGHGLLRSMTMRTGKRPSERHLPSHGLTRGTVEQKKIKHIVRYFQLINRIFSNKFLVKNDILWVPSKRSVNNKIVNSKSISNHVSSMFMDQILETQEASSLSQS